MSKVTATTRPETIAIAAAATSTISKTTIDTTTMNFDQPTATLFGLFDDAVETTMFEPQQQKAVGSMELNYSKPRQTLGESVFSQFISGARESVSSPEELTLLENMDVPELSPSVGTITPMQLHSSIVESVFSPSIAGTSPMFEETEMDSDNWESLFEPSELLSSIPAPAEKDVTPLVETKEIAAETPEVARPLCSKRSASEADLSLPVSKKPSTVDELGVTAYNRKQRVLPLSPIVVDSSDPIAAKRARNTEAARRSRARKMERMSQLEDKVEELQEKNEALEQEVERLRALLAQR